MRRALPGERRADALGKSVGAFLKALHFALIFVGKSDGPPRLPCSQIPRNGLSSVQRCARCLLSRLRP